MMMSILLGCILATILGLAKADDIGSYGGFSAFSIVVLMVLFCVVYYCKKNNEFLSENLRNADEDPLTIEEDDNSRNDTDDPLRNDDNDPWRTDEDDDPMRTEDGDSLGTDDDEPQAEVDPQTRTRPCFWRPRHNNYNRRRNNYQSGNNNHHRRNNRNHQQYNRNHRQRGNRYYRHQDRYNPIVSQPPTQVIIPPIINFLAESSNAPDDKAFKIPAAPPAYEDSNDNPGSKRDFGTLLPDDPFKKIMEHKLRSGNFHPRLHILDDTSGQCPNFSWLLVL